MHGTTSDLSQAEEMSALPLCNIVLCILNEGAERLDRFGECRDKNGRDGTGETPPSEAPCEEEMEDKAMDGGSKEDDYEGH